MLCVTKDGVFAIKAESIRENVLYDQELKTCESLVPITEDYWHYLLW